MYTREQLLRYPYFVKVLEGIRVSDITDPLTGVIRREYIIGFAQYLISTGVPFSLGMVDIDNFKQINDNYGHATGDEVLTVLSGKLIDKLMDRGVVGRFGGDEFLFVNVCDLLYDDKRNFCVDLYGNGDIFRTNYRLSVYQPFVTATIGMSSYPADATTYIELFAKLDKCLYRGKSKGRNCFIIYVKEKHENIEIIKLKKKALFTVFKDVAVAFEAHDDIYEKMKAIAKVLEEDINVSDLYYINENNEVKSFIDKRSLGSMPEIDKLVKEVIYSSNNLPSIKDEYPETYRTLTENEIESLIIVKITSRDDRFGYVMCAEPHTLRIWQENEYAIMFLIAKMLSGYMSDRDLHFD